MRPGDDPRHETVVEDTRAGRHSTDPNFDNVQVNARSRQAKQFPENSRFQAHLLVTGRGQPAPIAPDFAGASVGSATGSAGLRPSR